MYYTMAFEISTVSIKQCKDYGVSLVYAHKNIFYFSPARLGIESIVVQYRTASSAPLDSRAFRASTYNGGSEDKQEEKASAHSQRLQRQKDCDLRGKKAGSKPSAGPGNDEYFKNKQFKILLKKQQNSDHFGVPQFPNIFVSSFQIQNVPQYISKNKAVCMAQNCSKEPKSSRVVPALKHTAVAPKLKLKAVSNAGLDLLVLQFTYNSFLLSTYILLVLHSL